MLWPMIATIAWVYLFVVGVVARTYQGNCEEIRIMQAVLWPVFAPVLIGELSVDAFKRRKAKQLDKPETF